VIEISISSLHPITTSPMKEKNCKKRYTITYDTYTPVFMHVKHLFENVYKCSRPKQKTLSMYQH
jgi:hypothetical protein